MLTVSKNKSIQKNTLTSYLQSRGQYKGNGPKKKKTFEKQKIQANNGKSLSSKRQKQKPTDLIISNDEVFGLDAESVLTLGLGMEDISLDDDGGDGDEYPDLESNIPTVHEAATTDLPSETTEIKGSKYPGFAKDPLGKHEHLGTLEPGTPNPFTKIYTDPENLKRRFELEMKNYHRENIYDYEDFTLFKKYHYNVDTFDTSKPITFFLVHSSWGYSSELGATLEFGGNIEGTNASIHATVTGFSSNFFVKLLEGWQDGDVQIFIEYLNRVVLDQYKWSKRDRKIVDTFSQVFVSHEYTVCTELKDYTSDEKSQLIKIYSAWPKAIAAARHVLNEPSKYDWPYAKYVFNVFEADVDFTQRYFLDSGIKPSKWFYIEGMYYEVLRKRETQSTASLVVRCSYRDLVMLDTQEYKQKKPDFSIISYDTEWKNIPRRFVHLAEDPIIVISVNAYKFLNPNVRKSILFVYTRDGLLPEDLPKVDYFYWFRSEPGLLAAFKDFIEYTDVDIIIDYNGSEFDLRSIGEAGTNYFGQVYLALGRDKRKYIYFSSTEWRNKISYKVEIFERIVIDMLKVVRNTPLPGKQFNGYTLGHVSQVLLGETKIEFDVNLMHQKWHNIKTIGEIWRYGDKDALLPGKLADNMNVINTAFGMSEMTSLTVQKVLNRGAGSKIEGFLRTLCIEKDGVERVILECFKKISSGKNVIDTCAKEVIGANVIKPRTGFYNTHVFVLDVNSEYPTIIILINLCLSTFVSNYAKENGLVDYSKYWTIPTFKYEDGEIRLNVDKSNASFVTSDVKLGILPEAEKKLWAWRNAVKGDMKEMDKKKDELKVKLKELEEVSKKLEECTPADETTKARLQAQKEETSSELFKYTFQVLMLDGLQTAIKTIMNGIFGQTIFAESRFYKKEIGSTILQFGRYLLNYVKYFVEHTFTRENGWPFDAIVIYGDTDSVFITFINPTRFLDFAETVSYAKIIETKVNENFSNTKPVKMELEKIYIKFLMITAKNYIGLKCKSLDNDKDLSLDTKGMKHKKSGTSPLAQKMGKKLERLAMLEGNVEGALQYVRNIVIRLRRRQVTKTKLIFTVNVGRDLTAAIHQYMTHQIACGNPPPPETERSIREKYAKLSNDLKSKSSTATISTVYAYRQLCRDSRSWTNRGMTINYIYVEGGLEVAKRELIAPVDECVELDLPYNVTFYIDEVMRISSKIMAHIVGDTDTKNPIIYRKLILSDPVVVMTPISKHISFFENRHGTKTLKLNDENIQELTKECDDPIVNKVIVRLIEKYNTQKQYSKRENLNTFFAYNFTRCILCSNELHPFEKDICGICTHNYHEVLPVEMKAREEYKNAMAKVWKTCSDCLKSDEMDPMDCINITCHNYTKRTDVTKKYYMSYSKLSAVVDYEKRKRGGNTGDLKREPTAEGMEFSNEVFEGGKEQPEQMDATSHIHMDYGEDLF